MYFVLRLDFVMLVLLGTKYFGRHSCVTSKQINVNQALSFIHIGKISVEISK
jgi:hypothetical protein